MTAARHHAALTDEFESANASTWNVERVNRGLIKAGDLSEYQELTPARDDIDFAEGTPPAPSHNAESVWRRETLLAVRGAGQVL